MRQAIAYAIDRVENCTVAFGESCRPIKYMVGFTDAAVPTWLSADQIAKLNTYDYDPAKAEALLTGIGFTERQRRHLGGRQGQEDGVRLSNSVYWGAKRGPSSTFVAYGPIGETSVAEARRARQLPVPQSPGLVSGAPFRRVIDTLEIDELPIRGFTALLNPIRDELVWTAPGGPNCRTDAVCSRWFQSSTVDGAWRSARHI